MADVSIPEYVGIRSVVPGTYDPTRRAGSGGQRYFTDVQYVPAPSFRGDRATYDVKNYLAANPDVIAEYETNKEELIEGGDERFETVEGFGKYHYDTFGKYEGRPLSLDPTGDPVAIAQNAADAAALVYQQQNADNPARQGLASLQRVTNDIIKKDMGDLRASDATEREKIEQTRGYMNKNAVSPYRIAHATQTPLASIQESMSPYYQTETEQAQYDLTNVVIQNALQNAVDMVSVNDLIGSGQITVEELAGYFGRPVEEVREFYLNQRNNSGFNQGGITSVQTPQKMYLGGATDGMADNVPASINGNQPAALSDGEFVVPADVVSHLGNGNSDAGAKQLYSMMDRVRQARTGRKEQGREIDPNKFLA